MHNQHKQYVILTIVLLACGAGIFFGVRNIVRSTDEVTTFAVGDWEGITLPRYYGPAVYTTSQRSMATVTLPMTSTSSRSLFHHNAVPAYRTGVANTKQVQMNYTAHKLYRTSEHKVHSIGSGNGSAGSVSSGASFQRGSSSSAVSMPTLAPTLPSVRTQTLALNNINIAASSSSLLADASTVSNRLAMGPRRTPSPSEPGTEEVVVQDSEGWWYWDGEGWVPAEVKIEGGKVYRWNGADWVYVQDQADPDAPIGDIPWLMILFAAAAFGICKGVKRKKT